MLLSASVDLGDPNSVSPGILGFLAFFLLAVALILLVRNMNGHLRRMRYRADRSAEPDAESSDPTPPADPPATPE